MHGWGTRFWLVGWLIIGSGCILPPGGRGCTSSHRRGTGPGPTAFLAAEASAVVDSAQAPSRSGSGVPVPVACAPEPASRKVVNVRHAPYGARGDGKTDDTAAIQKAVDAIGGTGGTVLVPEGIYLVNAAAQAGMGIQLRSSMTLKLAAGATLKAIPNASEHYAILALKGVSQVTILGGTLVGERHAHTGTRGEWGMGVSISDSHHVLLDGVTAMDCWGDGFYVSNRSSDVTLCHVVADRNRRQGLSITSVNGMAVRNSVFRNTAGTEPEAGLDVEPNEGETVADLLVTGCTMADNAGGGIQCGFNTRFKTSRILNVVFDRNTITGNGVNPTGGGYRAAVKVDYCLGQASITNNVISQNLGQGIMVMEFSAHTIVKGNTVTGTLMFNGNDTWTGGGIYISQSPQTQVIDNLVQANAGGGIWLVDKDPTVLIRGNTVSGNGGHGIRQAVAEPSELMRLNRVSGNGKTP